jgi:hypothetical protein
MTRSRKRGAPGVALLLASHLIPRRERDIRPPSATISDALDELVANPIKVGSPGRREPRLFGQAEDQRPPLVLANALTDSPTEKPIPSELALAS